jgi:hypothetical protein
MNQQKSIIAFQIIFPMITGCIIYALFRDVNLIDPEKKFFPIIKSQYNNNIITNSLSDGLWLYSLNATFLVIWKNNSKEMLSKWILASLVLSVLLEYLQYYNIINGTFDVYDIYIYIASVLLFFIINKNTFTKKSFA